MSSETSRADISFDPRTGANNGQVAHSTPAEVDAALAAAVACAPRVAVTSPATRATWLRAIADAMDAAAGELVRIADEETALGAERLTGEHARVCCQLRFYADAVEEGSWLEATIDRPSSAHAQLARMQVALGPVAVFGASNFPFAFGSLGNDTAMALAAGCPVLVKAHPAHPRLAQRLAEIAIDALTSAGAPRGCFASVRGFEAGLALVRDDRVRAVAFTGSQSGGMALWREANKRERVIPVLAEMGTVNPVIVTPSACESVEQKQAIATGFATSFTAGAGQFCTKPGIIFVPHGSGLTDEIAAAVRQVVTHPALTQAIAQRAHQQCERLVDAGARLLAHGGIAEDVTDSGWRVTPTLLAADAETVAASDVMREECFGPVALVCEYASPGQLAQVVTALQGSLAGAMFCADSDPDAAAALALLTPQVGRVAVNEWPTGVAWTWAQHHGGPWPSTSNPATTSVGAYGLGRFTRPVTWQNCADAMLPPALQEANPWRIPRRIDSVVVTP